MTFQVITVICIGAQSKVFFPKKFNYNPSIRTSDLFCVKSQPKIDYTLNKRHNTPYKDNRPNPIIGIPVQTPIVGKFRNSLNISDIEGSSAKYKTSRKIPRDPLFIGDIEGTSKKEKKITQTKNYMNNTDIEGSSSKKVKPRHTLRNSLYIGDIEGSSARKFKKEINTQKNHETQWQFMNHDIYKKMEVKTPTKNNEGKNYPNSKLEVKPKEPNEHKDHIDKTKSKIVKKDTTYPEPKINTKAQRKLIEDINTS